MRWEGVCELNREKRSWPISSQLSYSSFWRDCGRPRETSANIRV